MSDRPVQRVQDLSSLEDMELIKMAYDQSRLIRQAYDDDPDDPNPLVSFLRASEPDFAQLIEDVAQNIRDEAARRGAHIRQAVDQGFHPKILYVLDRHYEPAIVQVPVNTNRPPQSRNWLQRLGF